MTRHIYALIVDADEESEAILSALERMADLVRTADLPAVHSVVVSIDAPMAEDERRQDRDRSSPEIRLVDVG